ncbi:MAG: hypothetical protein ACTSQK_08800 [Candidatus Heimdallarchaeota archaeon]
MKINGIHAKSENGISYIHHILCEKCQNSIEVPIKRSEKDSAVGGIFRVVVIHQCIDEQIAFMLYFDENLALRQKVSTPVTVAELQQIDLLDKAQLPDMKQYNGFIYLHKKLGAQLAQVIYGAIIGQQIVFLGEKTEVEPTCLAITAFTKHRITQVECWANKKSNASILGTKPKNIDLYEDSLVVNLPKNHVINGIENSYCTSLLQKLHSAGDKDSFFEIIEEEINLILNYCIEYATVKSLDEAEYFLTALALDDLEQDALTIILPIASQMNHNIANYYRKYNDSRENNEKKSLEPMIAWVYRKTTEEIKKFILNPKKLPIFTQEDLYIEALKTISTIKLVDEIIIEYITPLSYTISFFDNYDFYAFNYARTTSEYILFNNTLNMLNRNLEFFSRTQVITDLNAKFLSDKFKEINSLDITEKSVYTKMKEILHENDPFAVIGRHYISSIICKKNLKKFAEKITELISKKYNYLDPRIFHYNNLYVIKDTISNYENDQIPVADKVKIGFNFNFLVTDRDPSKLIDIVLELYIEPSEYKLGFEYTKSFLEIYKVFTAIIKKAQETCSD